MSRIIISAAHRSSGKTTICIGLCAALRKRGLIIQPFKKGPDYIDPMWLTAAAGKECLNLDFFMMGEKKICEAFQQASQDTDLSLIEGNMGFYDGLDIDGKDSTSYLSKILKTPVLLVIDASRMTYGVAPLVFGYQHFDPDNLISGIILNNVASTRHEVKLKEAIYKHSDLEILGAIPRLSEIEIKERHLGLIPIKEELNLISVIESIAAVIQNYVDLDKVISLSKDAFSLPTLKKQEYQIPSPVVKIGIARDPVFTFYYKDNLDALARAGAELVPFNTLTDDKLPQVDGLYFGGGFPEIFIESLSKNKSLLTDIRTSIEQGIPVYAECGGLMYLARNISYQGITKEMVGAIPCDICVYEKPQGHGYVILQTTTKNQWFNFDGKIRGHEFHYSQITNPAQLDFGYNVIRGKGVNGRHDGIIYKNVIASYTHFHSLGVPHWAQQFVSFVERGKAYK
ncbi:MAG: cobyrinate a,c-diamide synthase [bacterium]